MLKFSIITPNLNQGRYLESNLSSISAQSHPSVEHIVLDCSSCDESADVLQHFKHSKKFIYIQDSDRGQSDAINKGFQFATGEIIAWLNADDQYTDENTLTSVASVFDNNPEVDIVYGRGDYVNSETGDTKAAWIQTEANELHQTLSYSVGIIQPSLFFRKSVLNEIGFLDVSNHHSMDYDFWIRMSKANLKFHFLDKSLSRALLHNDSKSVKNRTVQLRETLDVCAKHYGFAHPRWITAYARSAAIGDPSFLDSDYDSIDDSKQQEIDSIERELFRIYNASPVAAKQFRQIDSKSAEDYLNRFFPKYDSISYPSCSNRTLESQNTCDISFYPQFGFIEDFLDQLNRIKWYLPSNSGLIIRLFVSEELRLKLQDERTVQSIPSNVSIAQTPKSTEEFQRIIYTSRTVGIWRNFGKNSPAFLGIEGLRVFNLDKHHENRREAFQYSVLLHELDWPNRLELTKFVDAQAPKLLNPSELFHKAYLFCTGPSITDAYNYDYSDGYRIVCNSIVNNDTLMEKVQPHFIVAADPVFHFGSSEYSYAFREKLWLAAEKYNASILVPFFFFPLIARNCPHLLSRTIGITQDPNIEFNFNLRYDCSVRGSDNILTILMIPLGATLATELYVLGCDGRKPGENYFWKHDRSSQFDYLMQNAREHHPAFFDHCDYSDYYDKHCSNLEQMIISLEAQGKRLNTLTKSHIPCLAARSAITPINP